MRIPLDPGSRLPRRTRWATRVKGGDDEDDERTARGCIVMHRETQAGVRGGLSGEWGGQGVVVMGVVVKVSAKRQ